MISYSLPYIWRWRGDLRSWNGKSCCWCKENYLIFFIILCIFLSQVKREITLKVLFDFFYFSIGTGNMGEGGGDEIRYCSFPFSPLRGRLFECSTRV